MDYNTELQFYRGVPLRLEVRENYDTKKAKCFSINNTQHTIWIPNRHLLPNGTLKPQQKLTYIFSNANKQLEAAGVMNTVTYEIKVKTKKLKCSVCDDLIKEGSTAIGEFYQGNFVKACCYICSNGRFIIDIDEESLLHEQGMSAAYDNEWK